MIDFRKLNSKTVADKYPMPNITMILSNLVDLAERDREKSAFSVNGGKYEFCRLPFGLKNVASIFQRTIDDVLRGQSGKSCYVYVDVVIIFSENEKDHVRHVDWVLKSFLGANMRVAHEMSQFFRDSVEYLGFVVTEQNRIRKKVNAIREYPEPTTVCSVRCYFIKDFAAIAKPMSDILKGENGLISKYRSQWNSEASLSYVISSTEKPSATRLC